MRQSRVRHSKYASLVVEWDRGRFAVTLRSTYTFRPPPFNTGAGYLGGYTAYVAVNAVNPRDPYRFFTKRLQVGLTRNAHRVPYLGEFKRTRGRWGLRRRLSDWLRGRRFCESCGGVRTLGESCGCFDNGSE